MSDLELSKWRISVQAERIGSLNESLREGHAHTPLYERFLHKVYGSYGKLDGYGEPGEIEKLRACLRAAGRRLDRWTEDPECPEYLRQGLRWIGSARGWARKLKDEGSPAVSSFVDEECSGIYDIYDFQEGTCFTLQEEHGAECACYIATEQMKAIADE